MSDDEVLESIDFSCEMDYHVNYPSIEGRPKVSAGEMQATVSRDARGRFMPGVSGNPLGQIKAKCLTALYTELASDFGGEDQLTAAGRLLLEQACRLKLRAEREHNPNHAVRLSNASARLLAKVATERRPESPPPSLETYRRAKHEAPP